MPRNLMPVHTGSAAGADAVTPHDTNELSYGTTRALYIGAAGNLVVTMADGGNATFTAVPVGILPIQVTRVLATGTTASSILALY